MAPAIATPVASKTLSVASKIATNRMVEKKSAASLANGFFIALLSVECGVSTRSIVQCVSGKALAGGVPYFALRYSGYHLVKYTALLRAANAISNPDHSGRPGT